MTDVARRAGVSQSTVSYVLNGTRPISAEVRTRVEAAMRELQYAPRAAARALRGGTTQTLALSLPESGGVMDPWLGLYLLRLTLAAKRRGYDLLVSAEAADAAAALQQIAAGRRADGAILMSVTRQDPRLRVAKSSGFPTVALGRPARSDVPFVDFDFARAAEMALTEFASLGHRRVLYVGPSQGERDGGYLYVERLLDGMSAAARALDIDVLTFTPARDPRLDGERFARMLHDNNDCRAAVLSRSFTSFELFRSTFTELRPESDPAQDLIVLGASGLPGDDESVPKRIVNPIDTLATASVDCAVELIEGRSAVSRLVAPQFVGASAPF